jgi:hypothetical protein
MPYELLENILVLVGDLDILNELGFKYLVDKLIK